MTFLCVFVERVTYVLPQRRAFSAHHDIKRHEIALTNGSSKYQSLMVIPNRLVPKSNCSSIGCPLSIINWWIYHYGNLIIPSWSVAKSSLSYGSLRIYQLSICWLQDACPPFQRQRHSHINACWLFLLSYPTILYHHIKSPVGIYIYIYVGIFIYIYIYMYTYESPIGYRSPFFWSPKKISKTPLHASQNRRRCVTWCYGRKQKPPSWSAS